MCELVFIDDPNDPYIHPISFPWRKYTKKELLIEFERLKKRINTKITFPIKRSIIGYPCSNYFFQKERLNTDKFCCMSSVKYWKSKSSQEKKKIQNFSKKYKQDDFTSIVCMSHTPAQFPIVAAGLLYKYFNASNIFDPYSGWGDRCIAAMATNINYTGVDSNDKLLSCFQEMVNTFVEKSESEVVIMIDKVENIDYKNIKTDLVFTSPPFWTKDKILLEKYNNCEEDYNIFMDKSLLPLFHFFLIKKIPICLHIPELMYKDIVKKFGNCQEKIEIKSNYRPGKNSLKDIIYCWY